MDRLRTPAARLLLALGLLAWIGVAWADRLHAYLVVHAVCPDHGEIVELAGGGHHAGLPDHGGPSIGDADAHDGHEHGCAHLLFQVQALPALAVVYPPPSARPLVAQAVGYTAAPRGPPLAWAPKTSPPSAS